MEMTMEDLRDLQEIMDSHLIVDSRSAKEAIDFVADLIMFKTNNLVHPSATMYLNELDNALSVVDSLDDLF